MPNPENNLLFEYCKDGNIEGLLTGLDSVLDGCIENEHRHSLLSYALKHGQWKIAEALIEKKHIESSGAQPLLVSACQYINDDIKGIQYALRIDSNIDRQNTQDRTALMTSCLMGHFNKSRILLKNNANCHLIDTSGNNALIDAIQSKNKKLITLILKQGPKINHSNKYKETAIILELKQNSPNESVIQQLLKAGADPEMSDIKNKSAWLMAKQKHPKIARIIETHLNNVNQMELPIFSNDYQKQNDNNESQSIDKVDPNSQMLNQTSAPETILSEEPEMTAADANTQVEVKAQKGIDKTVHINKTKQNTQEWFLAAKTGNLGSLNRMVIAGIDINCKDKKGCTALIRACGHSRRAVVSYLMQQNANIEARSDNGSTGLSSSIIGNCRRVTGLLLENGANPNGKGPADYSYATIAAAQWNDGMLSILFRFGSDIFLRNKKQQNLLHITALAAEYTNNISNAKATIKFLLDHGMDINAKDEDGNTALMILTGCHKTRYKVTDSNIASIAHIMIKLGASAAIVNNQNKSALDASKYHKLIQTKGVIMNALSWNNS